MAVTAMTVKADQRVPVLILKLGQYPLDSGGLAAVRTLGRLGIPVYAITEDPVTPAAGVALLRCPLRMASDRAGGSNRPCRRSRAR